jgi:Putative Actinobacterial Holin-X, holin superfamily III
MNSNADGA